jgi:hypothetical protein
MPVEHHEKSARHLQISIPDGYLSLQADNELHPRAIVYGLKIWIRLGAFLSYCDPLQPISAHAREIEGGYGEERPPFVSESSGKKEIGGDLRMTNRLLHLPFKAVDRTRGWSKSHNVLDLLMLGENEFIARCRAEGNFSLIVT